MALTCFNYNDPMWPEKKKIFIILFSIIFVLHLLHTEPLPSPEIRAVGEKVNFCLDAYKQKILLHFLIFLWQLTL